MNSEIKQGNRRPLQVISVTGGKGGIGKTNMAINIAISLAKQNQRVMLFDADLGLANVDVLLGLKAKKNIHHVLAGECSLRDICIEGPHGISIVPSASGIQKMAEIGAHETQALIQAFSELTDEIDTLIIDTAAGISNQVLHFAYASQEVIVVVCNEPAAIADAYALIKLLNTEYRVDRFWLLSNMVRSHEEGQSIYAKMQHMTTRFLNLNLHFLGEIPFDDHLYLAVKHRKAVVDEFPGSKSAKAIVGISNTISNWVPAPHTDGRIAFFLERLIECQQYA